MVKKWRTVVKPSHTVLHLGDLFFGKKNGLERFTYEIAPKLPGKKYLILGNHDPRNLDYEALGFTVLKPYQIEYRNYFVSFDHYPRIIHDNEKRIHVHGHLHKNGYGPDGSPTRPNNINVSVEVIDYRPQRLTSLLNTAIRSRNGHKDYYNSKAYRRAKTKRGV